MSQSFGIAGPLILAHKTKDDFLKVKTHTVSQFTIIDQKFDFSLLFNVP